MPTKINLPNFLCRWLDSWGHTIWEDFLSSATASCPSFASNCCCVPSDLRVGTDCSGVDSPVHALMAMGVSFNHVFSCENAWAPRQVIAANTMPTQDLFNDVHSKYDVVPFVDLYVAGFSCKPFSMLHFGTKLLEEPEAEVFFSVLRRIKLLQPPAFVLENVAGISRCLDQVLALLKEAGYIVAAHCLNPVDLGEPVNRPRYYFVGARADVALVGPGQAQTAYESLWESLKQLRSSRTSCTSGSKVAPLLQRLLPSDHAAVLSHQDQCKQKWKKAAKEGFPDTCGRQKWRDLHENWAKTCEFQHPEGNPQLQELTPDRLWLHLPRERDGWWKLIRTTEDPTKVVADISQSLGRMPCRDDGALPTITPGGRIVVAGAARLLVPAEKLLLHALPLHRMIIPDGVSDADLESMGGNMMHLHTVAVAMLVALSFVDWSRPQARSLSQIQPSISASLAAPAAPVKRRPVRNRALWNQEKALENKIRARFNMVVRKPAKKRGCKKRKVVKVPKHIGCLRGTRWASSAR
eukprot:Skav202749  [mRNA]  locus=scaffold3516:15161:16726:+ [translate_table: standard]